MLTYFLLRCLSFRLLNPLFLLVLLLFPVHFAFLFDWCWVAYSIDFAAKFFRVFFIASCIVHDHVKFLVQRYGIDILVYVFDFSEQRSFNLVFSLRWDDECKGRPNNHSIQAIWKFRCFEGEFQNLKVLVLLTLQGWQFSFSMQLASFCHVTILSSWSFSQSHFGHFGFLMLRSKP